MTRFKAKTTLKRRAITARHEQYPTFPGIYFFRIFSSTRVNGVKRATIFHNVRSRFRTGRLNRGGRRLLGKNTTRPLRRRRA